MPPELLTAIANLKKAIMSFPSGAAGSGSAEARVELSEASERLRNLYSKHKGPKSSEERKLKARSERISIATSTSIISDIIKRSERLYAIDRFLADNPAYSNARAAERIMEIRNPGMFRRMEYDAEYGEDARKVRTAELKEIVKDAQEKVIDPIGAMVKKLAADQGIATRSAKTAINKILKTKADDYILSLKDPKQYRDIEGRRKWGNEWDSVKAAEDNARAAERIFGGIKSTMKIGGTFTAGFATGYNAYVSLSKLITTSATGLNKFNAALFNTLRTFNISGKLMEAFTSTGMDYLQAAGMSGKLDVWTAGLKYGVGIEKIQALSMAGFDVGGLDFTNLDAEKFMKYIAPQVRSKTKAELASAMALGALSAEEIRGAQTYEVPFAKLQPYEKVMAERAGAEAYLNMLRIKTAESPDVAKRVATIKAINALERQGPDWYLTLSDYVPGMMSNEAKSILSSDEWLAEHGIFSESKRKKEEWKRNYYKKHATDKIGPLTFLYTAGDKWREEYLNEKYEDYIISKEGSTLGVGPSVNNTTTTNQTIDVSGMTITINSADVSEGIDNIPERVANAIVVATNSKEVYL